MKYVCVYSQSTENFGEYFIRGKTYDLMTKGPNEHFMIDEDNYPWYFDSSLKQKFITLSEYRKQKLKKIYEHFK